MSRIFLMGSLLSVSLLLVGCGASDSDDSFTTQSVEGADEVAICLNNVGAKMYGTERCGYCKKQKEAFGNAFTSIGYIDCDKTPDICAGAGIEGFPTRVINGQKYPGKKELSELKSLTDC